MCAWYLFQKDSRTAAASDSSLAPGKKSNHKDVLNSSKMDENVLKLTLAERMAGHIYPTYNNEKFYDYKHKNETPSGHCVFINECNNLGIVDIDIHKEVEYPTSICADILQLLPEDIPVTQTCSTGLHIYCNIGDL